MDYLLMLSTDTAYPILESKFEASLTHSERMLKSNLREFLNKLPIEVKEAPAWARVKQLFQDLGSESKRVKCKKHNTPTNNCLTDNC